MSLMAYYNYIDKWTCIGMMNKNCALLSGGILGFNKTKSGSITNAFRITDKCKSGNISKATENV